MSAWLKQIIFVLLMLVVTVTAMDKALEEQLDAPLSVTHVLDSDQPLETAADLIDQALISHYSIDFSDVFPSLLILLSVIYFAPYPRRILRPPLTH